MVLQSTVRAYLGYWVRREFVVDGGKLNGKRPLSWSWSASQERKCREKRKRERERPTFLRVRGKPIKPLHRTCTAHEGTGLPLKEVLEALVVKWARQASTLRTAGCGEQEPLFGFGTKKCRVKELEKARFGKRMRLALYRNRSLLMRRDGAAVRLVRCCTNPRKE